jgi:hypothetical protein
MTPMPEPGDPGDDYGLSARQWGYKLGYNDGRSNALEEAARVAERLDDGTDHSDRIAAAIRALKHP